MWTETEVSQHDTLSFSLEQHFTQERIFSSGLAVFQKAHYWCFPCAVFAVSKLPSFRSLPTTAVWIASISVFLLRVCHSSLGGNKFTLSSRTQKFLWKSQLKSKHCSRLYYFVVREQDIMTFFS